MTVPTDHLPPVAPDPPRDVPQAPPYRALERGLVSKVGRSAGRDWLVVVVILLVLASLTRWSAFSDAAIRSVMGFAPRW